MATLAVLMTNVLFLKKNNIYLLHVTVMPFSPYFQISLFLQTEAKIMS